MTHLKVKVALALVAVTVLGFLLHELVAAHFQIKSKEEWSLLDVVGSRYRLNTDESKILIASINGYQAIGIRVDSEQVTSLPSKYPRVWFLPVPRYREMVKELPQGADYAINRSDMDLILRDVPGISAATLAELRKHLRE